MQKILNSLFGILSVKMLLLRTKANIKNIGEKDKKIKKKKRRKECCTVFVDELFIIYCNSE